MQVLFIVDRCTTLRSLQKKHSLEEWQKVIDVNLSGTFNVTTNWVEKVISKRKRVLSLTLVLSVQKGMLVNQPTLLAKQELKH